MCFFSVEKIHPKDSYNLCSLVEVSGQGLQKSRLLKEPSMAVYMALGSPLNDLVPAVASGARPKLCGHLDWLLYL